MEEEEEEEEVEEEEDINTPNRGTSLARGLVELRNNLDKGRKRVEAS